MGNLFNELRRRNVFRVAGVYAVAGWLLVQVAIALETALSLPAWFDAAITAALLIGFPIALILAWAFEMTPEGVKLTANVDEAASIAPQTGRKLDYVIIAGLALVAGLAIWQQLSKPTVVYKTAEETANGAQHANAENAIAQSSIAVLPFTDLSPDGDQEYFSDGIAEEILNVLVRIDKLQVASRTSAFGFKGQEALGIPTIAEKLKVRHVLEGSVRKAGDQVRITAQLIDAQTDQHLWSETYDRKLTTENIFAIQDDIANAIARELGLLIKKDGAGTPAVKVEADTQSLDAYELYLRGHKLFIERSDIPGAIDYLEKAVAADENFARAWSTLAAAYSVAPSWEYNDREYTALAKQAVDKAMTLNPDLALPYAVKANVLFGERPPDHEAGLANIAEALKRDPKETSAYLWGGSAKLNLGYFAEAEKDFLKCLELDPAYELCRRYEALSLLYRRQADRALALFEEGAEKGAGGHIDPFIHAYAAKGDRAAVLQYVFYHTEGLPPAYVALVSRAYLEPGFDFDKERPAIEAGFAAAAGVPIDWDDPARNFITFLFRNYAKTSDATTFVPYKWRPYPEAWRVSPDRKRLIAEAGLPAYWRKHGFPPQCHAVGEDDFECE